MRLKKGIIILWVAFAVSLLVTLGLLANSSKKSVESKQDQAADTVLEVYAWSDERETFRALTEGFMEQYPDIQVHVQYLPSSENIQGLQIALNGDSAIDVIAIGTPAAAAQMIEKNQVMDLSKVIQDVDLSGLYVLMESLKSDGKTYMLPYRNSAWVVYYNKDMFDEAQIPYPKGDWSWEEYVDLAEALTDAKKGQYGSLNFENNWWRVPVRTAGAEDPMRDKDLQLFVKAAEWNYELTYEKKAAIPYNQLTSVGSKDYVGRFLSGEAAMMYCGEWCLSMMRERIEKEYPHFSYDVAKLPCWDKEKSYAIGSPAVLMVAEKSQKKEAAVLFLKYASGEEGAKRIWNLRFS